MESNRDLLKRCRQTLSEIETLVHSTQDSPLLDDAFMRLRFAVKEVTRRFEIQLTSNEASLQNLKENRKQPRIGIENATT